MLNKMGAVSLSDDGSLMQEDITQKELHEAPEWRNDE
jgi:hypothetical protein